MRIFSFIVLALAMASADAQRYEAPPLVRFISIHTSFSNLPSIYIDEWGNARIATFCKGAESPHLDLKLGKAAFERAAQTLAEIEFHNIPYQPNYEYTSVNGKKVLSLTQSSHQAKYHVTFNEEGPWNNTRGRKKFTSGGHLSS